MLPAELAAWVASAGAPGYRAEQIFRWLHGQTVAAPDDMTNVPPALRAALAAEHPFAPLTQTAIQVARDGTRKLRFATHDGRSIESVLIPDDDQERDKLTLCVSSQVGCAIDCGSAPPRRWALGATSTAGEIVEQVYRATAARRPPAHEPGVHGDGRAAAQLRQRDPRAARCSSTRGARLLAPADHGVDRRAGAGHREARREDRPRPTWPSRSTPPPTRSATGSCRSTASGPSRCCSTRPARFPLRTAAASPSST